MFPLNLYIQAETSTEDTISLTHFLRSGDSISQRHSGGYLNQDVMHRVLLFDTRKSHVEALELVG